MKKPKPKPEPKTAFEDAARLADEAILLLYGSANTASSRQAYYRLKEARYWLADHIQDELKDGK